MTPAELDRVEGARRWFAYLNDAYYLPMFQREIAEAARFYKTQIARIAAELE